MSVASVITISDRCSAGTTEDTSGEHIVERLKQWRQGITISRQCVPDNVIRIQGTLNKAVELAAKVSSFLA